MSRKDQTEHTKLCWWLIERKVAYYKPEAVHSSWADTFFTSDDEYDAAELRYLELTRKLGAQNTLVHKGWPGYEDMLLPPHEPMMEVDESRPSVVLVMKRLGSNRWTG